MHQDNFSIEVSRATLDFAATKEFEFSALMMGVKFFTNATFANANQIKPFITPFITPKLVTSLLGLSTRHCTLATQLLSKKRRSGGEPLATLCRILTAGI